MNFIEVEFKDGSRKIINSEVSFKEKVRRINETQKLSDNFGDPINLEEVRKLNNLEVE